MINPNKTHRITNALVVAKHDYLSKLTFRTKGTEFSGYLDGSKLQVGDRATIYVRFSIVSDCYVVERANKKRIKQTA